MKLSLWGKIIMTTYQKQNFMSLLERFEKEQLSKAREKEMSDNEWRISFVKKYPRNSIASMQMRDYLITPQNASRKDSFCRRICSILRIVYHIEISDKARQEAFGITLKKGTQLTLSENLKLKYESDYDSAFAQIKHEIITLLDGADNDNYVAIESCGLSSDIKYVLLIIYCPEKVLPVCSESLLRRYCERLELHFDEFVEMIYYHQRLIQWKNDVPEVAGWSFSVFTSFCDWLYRNNQVIAGNALRSEKGINVEAITEEINGLNLQGKSKEAVIKVRVNQGIFRNKLLQRFSCCCLCGVSNKNLLIASHIKPWNACEVIEKLDCDNGFLMCPNHDRLFDQGWITFADDGKIIIAEALLEDDRSALNVRDNMNILLTDRNREYLKYHRQYVFKKPIL